MHPATVGNLTGGARVLPWMKLESPGPSGSVLLTSGAGVDAEKFDWRRSKVSSGQARGICVH